MRCRLDELGASALESPAVIVIGPVAAFELLGVGSPDGCRRRRSVGTSRWTSLAAFGQLVDRVDASWRSPRRSTSPASTASTTPGLVAACSTVANSSEVMSLTLVRATAAPSRAIDTPSVDAFDKRVHPGEGVREAQHSDRGQEDQQRAAEQGRSPRATAGHRPRPSRKRAIIAVPRNPTTDSNTSTGRNVPGRSPRRLGEQDHADDQHAVEGHDPIGKRRPLTSRTANRAAAMPSTVNTATITVHLRRALRDDRRPSRWRRRQLLHRATLRRTSPRSPLARTWTNSAGGPSVASTAIVPGDRARMLATVLSTFGESVRIGQRTMPDDQLAIGGDDLVGHEHVGDEQLREHGSGEAAQRHGRTIRRALARLAATGRRRAARAATAGHRGSWPG